MSRSSTPSRRLAVKSKMPRIHWMPSNIPRIREPSTLSPITWWPAIISPHPFVCLARDAITLFVETGQIITPLEGSYEQFEILRRQSGMFVTLRKFGELRGCMGTLEPACVNMALEIIENAISSDQDAWLRSFRFAAFYMTQRK